MGVYIPNMSKPKRCIKELDCGLLDEPCLFIDEREACLLQNNSKIGEYEENYKTCPLIEIDLVRCGECKWYDKDFKDCNIRDSYGWEYKPTDFCSYGERRADGNKRRSA